MKAVLLSLSGTSKEGIGSTIGSTNPTDLVDRIAYSKLNNMKLEYNQLNIHAQGGLQPEQEREQSHGVHHKHAQSRLEGLAQDVCKVLLMSQCDCQVVNLREANKSW